MVGLSLSHTEVFTASAGSRRDKNTSHSFNRDIITCTCHRKIKPYAD